MDPVGHSDAIIVVRGGSEDAGRDLLAQTIRTGRWHAGIRSTGLQYPSVQDLVMSFEVHILRLSEGESDAPCSA